MEKLESLIEEGEAVKLTCYKPGNMGGLFTGVDFDKWLYGCKIYISQYCSDIEIKKQIIEVIDNAHINSCESYNKIMGFLKAMENLGSSMENNRDELKKTKKIFVSHCSKNKVITHKFVNLLKMIGFDNDKLYYSSYEETGAEYLENCLESIKKEFDENELIVIFMLSREFYNSNVCLAEMGATWVKGKKYIPVILPPLRYSDIKGVVDPMQNSIMLLDEDIDTKLDKLKDTLESFISIDKKMELSEWTREKKNFINEIYTYFKQIKPIEECIEAIKMIDNKVVLKIVINNNTDKRYEFEEINITLKLKDGQEFKAMVNDCTIKSIVVRSFEKINFYINFENKNNLKASKIDIDKSEIIIDYNEVK